MNHLVRLFADIVLHRRGPADVPAASGVLGACLAAYLLAGAFALLPSAREPAVIVQQLAVDLVIVLVLFGGLLTVTGRAHRVRQTLSALFGTGALLSAASLPCIWIAAGSAGTGEPGPLVVASSAALLVILLLSLLVTGHIVRSAMDWPYAGGVLVAILYFGLSLEIFGRLFPEPA